MIFMKQQTLPITALVAAALAASPLLAQSQAGGRPAAPTAAPRAAGRLSGTVTDAATGKPVSYATVAVINPTTNSPVNGGVCGDDGKFVLPGLPAGTYRVEISFLGYQTQVRNGVTIGAGGTVALGTVALAATAQKLGEVVVTGQKALIEERVDRTVYNAENDQTTRGGDATDVLKRVPLLSVDLDGNVSLRGSSNIRVLINNKPSTIAANSIADALKQIPADQIKTVEVITSPSAKYDAEGSGGIINIVTKTNNLRGGSLGVDASAGLRSSNLSLNGSYRTGKMGFSLGGFGRAGYHVPGSFSNTQTTYNGGTAPVGSTLQSADTRQNQLFGRYTLGWDYDLDEHNSLAASVAYGVRNSDNYQDRLRTTYLLSSASQPGSVRDVAVNDHSGTVDASLNYTHTYETPQREFSILTLYSRNNRTNDFLNNVLNTNDYSINSRRRNDNESYNQEMTAQLDYQSPTAKNQLLELGAKDIVRRVNSNYTYLLANGASDAFYLDPNATLSNNFNYHQNVASGYATYTIGLPKGFTFKPGVRYEYTTIKANFANSSDIAIPDYGVLVPSVNLSRKFANGNVLKLAYNRRIQRPSLQFLNPNRQAANPLLVTKGNPELQPEYTNNYELGYSTLVKQKVNLNFSTFVRNTTGAIQAVRTAHLDTIITSYANAGREDAYGDSLFASVNAGKLTLNGGLDTYYAVLRNNDPNPNYNASNQGFVFNTRAFGSYALSKVWALQAFGFYRGQQVQLQGYQSGFGIYSLSVRRDFAEKKGSIGFGAENFFTQSINIHNEVTTPLLTQNSTNVIHNLSFKVNFSYRIGKLTADQRPRNRRNVSNDDLKEGGDNGVGGGADTGGGQNGGSGSSSGGQGSGARTGARPGGYPARPAGGYPGRPAGSAPQAAPTDSTKRSPVAQPDSAAGRQPATPGAVTAPGAQPAAPALAPAPTKPDSSAVKPRTPATTPTNAPSPGTTSSGGITPAGSPGGRP